MMAKPGMKYMLIEAETFGSMITAENGRLWRPEIKMVEFKAFERRRDNQGVFFDVGTQEIEKFTFTDANDMLTFRGKRWILLTPAFFKL